MLSQQQQVQIKIPSDDRYNMGFMSSPNTLTNRKSNSSSKLINAVEAVEIPNKNGEDLAAVPPIRPVSRASSNSRIGSSSLANNRLERTTTISGAPPSLESNSTNQWEQQWREFQEPHTVTPYLLRFQDPLSEHLFERHRYEASKDLLVYLLIVASIGSLGFAIWYESWIQISSIIAAVLLIGCTVISLYFKITRSEDLAFKFSSHITKGLFLLVSVICHIGLTEKALARSTCSDGLGDWVMLCFVVPFAVGITLQPDFRFILLVVVFNSAYSSVVEQNFVRNEQLNWCLSSKFNFVIYNLLIIPIYYIRERSIRYQFFSQKISEIRLDDAKREAQNANRAKRNFLSYIFHEIRVPLNAVAIGIDLLLEEKKENKVETKLDGEEDDSLPMLLKKQVESASHILDDVLSLQKIEEGRFEIEQEPFNIVHMIQTVAWTYHRICNEKHICLELDIDTTLKQKKVIGDQFRLRQVITNFISNALKFTSANGYIKITAKVIEKTEKGPVIEVSVRDNGIGISLEDQTRLFQPYVQVSAGELQKGRGTGLGLNISKHIIRLHEGKIGVKSIQNVGSKFFFHIPYRTPSKLDQKADMLSPKTSLVVSLSSKLRKNESSKAEALLSGAGLGSPPLFTPSNAISLSDSERLHDEVKLRSRRVLIVEDSATNSKLLGKMITKWNWEASFASNGKEAVSLFEQFLSHADGRADASPFDLVIMDKEMPVMHGDEAIRLIRSMGFDTPIIALTGNAFDSERQKLEEAGSDAFLSKPTTIEKLKTTVQAVFEAKGLGKAFPDMDSPIVNNNNP